MHHPLSHHVYFDNGFSESCQFYTSGDLQIKTSWILIHCEFQQLQLCSITPHYQEGNRFIEKREGGRCKWHSRRNVNTGGEGIVEWVTKCTDWYGERENGNILVWMRVITVPIHLQEGLEIGMTLLQRDHLPL